MCEKRQTWLEAGRKEGQASADQLDSVDLPLTPSVTGTATAHKPKLLLRAIAVILGMRKCNPQVKPSLLPPTHTDTHHLGPHSTSSNTSPPHLVLPGPCSAATAACCKASAWPQHCCCCCSCCQHNVCCQHVPPCSCRCFLGQYACTHAAAAERFPQDTRDVDRRLSPLAAAVVHKQQQQQQ